MEYASEQIVANSRNVASHLQSALGCSTNCRRECGILRTTSQRISGSCKNGFIINREPHVPRVIKLSNRVSAFDAIYCQWRWPIVRIKHRVSKSIVLQWRYAPAVLVQLSLEHDGGGDNKHGAFCRLIEAASLRAAIFNLYRLAGGQIQGCGQVLLLPFAQTANCPVQAER